MADNKEDLYGFIIDNCLYSSSQEDFLPHSAFAREDDDIFRGSVAGNSPSPEDFVYGESVAGVGNEIDLGKLGFREEKKESSLKLMKKGSPLVQCSGKVVIESEVSENEGVCHGGLMAKMVKPICCVRADGVECSAEKLGFYGGGGEGENTVENPAKKKLEFQGGMEDNGSEEGEGHVGKEANVAIEAEENEENVAKDEENVGVCTESIEVDIENVGKNDEIVDTEVIQVGDEGGISAEKEGVLYVETEMIEVDKEGGASMTEEMGNVDTEVIGADEEEGNNINNTNNVKSDELSDLDVGMIDLAEVTGVFEKGGSGTSKNKEIGNVDLKLGNCGKIDEETSNVDMEENEEIGNVDSEVVGVDEKQGNYGKIGEETRNVDMVEIVLEEEEEEEVEEEEGNCVEIGAEMNSMSKEEAKVNVDLKGVGVDDEHVICGKMDGKTRRMVRVDGEQENCGTIDVNNSNVDTVEIVVEEEEEEEKEEEEENCVEKGLGINGTSKEEEIVIVDSKVVGVDQEQGTCAKNDEETSNVVEMEDAVVEEEGRKDVSAEMSNAKEDKNKKPIEDILQGEGTRIREDEIKGRKKRKLPRSMFEQWSEGIRNGEGCSKEANVKETQTENSKSKDAEVATRCILDALKFLVGEKSYGGGGKVDFLETAKRRGMTFPQPRFRPAMDE